MGLGSNPSLGNKGKRKAAYRKGLEEEGEVSLTVDGALQLVLEFWREHVAEHPSDQRPKFSVAWLGDTEWCASLTDWGYRRSVSEFGPSAVRAIQKLAEKLACREDPWRPMKEKT